MVDRKTPLEVWEFLTRESRDGNNMSALHGVVERSNGEVTLITFLPDVSPEQIWNELTQQIGDFNVSRAIWGIDRYTQPGQGIAKKSLVTVYDWSREHPTQLGFRFGVLPYDETGCDELTWDHPHWRPIQLEEVDFSFSSSRAHSEALLAGLGLPPSVFDELAAELAGLRPNFPSQTQVEEIFNRLATEARLYPERSVH